MRHTNIARLRAYDIRVHARDYVKKGASCMQNTDQTLTERQLPGGVETNATPFVQRKTGAQTTSFYGAKNRPSVNRNKK